MGDNNNKITQKWDSGRAENQSSRKTMGDNDNKTEQKWILAGLKTNPRVHNREQQQQKRAKMDSGRAEKRRLSLVINPQKEIVSESLSEEYHGN